MSVASLSTQRARLDPVPLYVRFLEDKVETGQVFPSHLWVSPVSITPTVLRAHLSTTDAICS